ncbi:hypothetical protein PINS_up004092 [Pythium insidiosum]|nr:hypothetical protein PINS_up004092 [Pythium insidiosum]
MGDELGQTPLHVAAEYGRADVVHLLLDKGADLNARDWAGATPLEAAARSGRADIARLLSEHNGKVNVQGNVNVPTCSAADGERYDAKQELSLPFSVNDKAEKDGEASRTSAGVSMSSWPTTSPDPVVVDIDSKPSASPQEGQAVAPSTSPRELVHQHPLALRVTVGADASSSRGSHGIQGLLRLGRARGVARLRDLGGGHKDIEAGVGAPVQGQARLVPREGVGAYPAVGTWVPPDARAP